MASATAGNAFVFTCRAQDSHNVATPNYAGSLSFASSDTQATLPSNHALSTGVGTFTATLKTSGTQTITATDTLTGSIDGTLSVVVAAAAISTLTVTGEPASVGSGVAINLTVTAHDAYNNVATGYTGNVHFALNVSDTAAVLPANAGLTNGVGTFAATLASTGSGRTITVSDVTTSSISAVTGSISVAVGPVYRFTVSGVGGNTATHAVGKTVLVTAKDFGSNTVTTYAGTVAFSSSDSLATLPGNTTGFVNGAKAISGTTFNTTGSQTLTVTDTVTPSVTGVVTITVS